jgi:hypothetical protein
MTDKQEGAIAPRDIARFDPNEQPPEPPVPHHHRRFGKEEVPPGYIRHRGKRDPIGDELARVSLIVLVNVDPPTYGFAGPRQVHPEEWKLPQSEPGSVHYYKRDGTAPAHARMFHPPSVSA